jgi:hypothetical protein
MELVTQAKRIKDVQLLLVYLWANYLACEQQLQVAHFSHGGNAGDTLMKIFFSGFSSG